MAVQVAPLYPLCFSAMEELAFVALLSLHLPVRLNHQTNITRICALTIMQRANGFEINSRIIRVVLILGSA